MLRYAIVLWSLFMANYLFAVEVPGETSVGVGGITFHGKKTDPDLARHMPRKIDQGGRFVANPEVWVATRRESWVADLAVLKDSFDRPAIQMGLGLALDLSPYFTLGGMAGVLVRDGSPIHDDNGRDYQVADLPVIYQNGYTQFMPMLLITTTVRYPISGHLSFVTQGLSNYYLTHLTAGLAYQFMEK